MRPLSGIYKGEKRQSKGVIQWIKPAIWHILSLTFLIQHVYHQSGTYALSLSLGIGSMG